MHAKPLTSVARVALRCRSIEKGRRGAVKLLCQLLCVEAASIATARSLLIPAAAKHKAQRIEVKINPKDADHSSFWTGLGFIFTNDNESQSIAEMDLDPEELAAAAPLVAAPAPTASSATASTKRSPPPASSPTISKKRSRPQADDAENEERGQAAAARSGGSAASPRRSPHARAPSADSPQQSGSIGAPAAEPAAAGSEERRISPRPRAEWAPVSVGVPVGRPSPGRAPRARQGESFTDVYIRKTCPGVDEPHLVAVQMGVTPLGGSNLWQFMPEQELEHHYTVRPLAAPNARLQGH